MTIIAIGIDLAKNVFAVHGVDEMGKVPLLKPKVNRADLLSLLRSLVMPAFGTRLSNELGGLICTIDAPTE